MKIFCFNLSEELEFLDINHACKVDFEGLTFQSAQAAYQAQKNPSLAKEFVELSPEEALAKGQALELDDDWDLCRVKVMRRVLLAKFRTNPDLLDKLLEVDSKNLKFEAETVSEENAKSTFFWGTYEGQGLNVLGKLHSEIIDVLGIEQIVSKYSDKDE